MKTAARRPGRRLKEEADAGPAERERDDEAELARIPHDRIDREDGARHRGERRGQASMLSRRLNAFVIPTSQTRPSTSRARGADHLDREAEPGARGAELGDELRDRAERVDVVDEPGREEDLQPARIPPSSPRRLRRADRQRGSDPGEQAAEDADAPKTGVARSCQRLPRAPRRAVQEHSRAATRRG